VDPIGDRCEVQLGELPPSTEILVHGYTGLFGGDLSADPQPNQPPLPIRHPEGVRVVQDQNNLNGCAPYSHSHDGAAVLLNRGECTFLEKLIMAQATGAIGIIVISDEDVGVNPSAEDEELAVAGDLRDVAILLLTSTDGQAVIDLMDLAETDGTGQLRMVLQQPHSLPEGDGENARKENINRVLYLNGYPLLNTQLLVY
jgi:ER degradation enhancer, mannosidase alpha-like 1